MPTTVTWKKTERRQVYFGSAPCAEEPVETPFSSSDSSKDGELLIDC